MNAVNNKLTFLISSQGKRNGPNKCETKATMIYWVRSSEFIAESWLLNTGFLLITIANLAIILSHMNPISVLCINSHTVGNGAV